MSDTDDTLAPPPSGREAVEAVAAGPCRSCGLPQARTWRTPDGPARLCPQCATLHGLGCP